MQNSIVQKSGNSGLCELEGLDEYTCADCPLYSTCELIPVDLGINL